MNDKEKDFLTKLESAIEQKKTKKFNDEVMFYFLESCFNDEPYDKKDAALSDEFLNELFKLLTHKNILERRKSFYIYRMFNEDWGRFSSTQKLRIVDFLSNIYEQLKDSTSKYLVVEILGEYMADETGLEILNKFNKSKDEASRGLTAYGYRSFIQNSHNEQLKKLAKDKLKAMLSDSSKDIRDETKYELGFIT